MSNKTATNLSKLNIYLEEKDFYVGYHLFCLSTPIFYYLFKEVYHPQFLKVLSTLTSNNYFKILLNKQIHSDLLSTTNIFKTIFYISAQDCWSHLLFISLNSQTYPNTSNIIYDSPLLRREFKDFPSIQTAQLSPIGKISFGTKDAIKSLVLKKAFKQFFWEEQVGIPDYLKRYTNSEIIVDVVSDFLLFAWSKHHKSEDPITLRAIKKLLFKLKTDLTTDISFRIEFERLRYSIENAIANENRNTITETDTESIIDVFDETIDTYLSKQQKRITLKKQLQDIVSKILRNQGMDEDFSYTLSQFNQAWIKTKNRRKSDSPYTNDMGISISKLDEIIKDLASVDFIQNNFDDVCNIMTTLIEKRLMISKELNFPEEPFLAIRKSLKMKLESFKEKESSCYAYSKVKDSSYIYKFLFELVIYYTSKYQNIFFITVLEEIAQDVINRNKTTKHQCEYKVLQHLYASTLGIYGLSKRKISDFRSSSSKSSLNITDSEKDALNSMLWLYNELCLGIPGDDKTKTLNTLAFCQKFFTIKKLGSSSIFINNLPNYEKELKQLLSIRLERLNSLNHNRIDENFIARTLFKRIEKCHCSDNELNQARLSVVLGIFTSMLLNIDMDNLNQETNGSTQNLSIIEQLETLDLRIAKIFGLLNWDLKLIVDAIAMAIENIDGAIIEFKKTFYHNESDEITNEITTTYNDANIWDRFCLKYCLNSSITTE